MPCACSARGSTRTPAKRAFCALIRARARQAASPLAVISGGLSRRELLRLIGPWQRFAAKEFGVTLTVNRLKVSRADLARHLAGLVSGARWQESVAIIGLDGIERHWTVAYAATKRTLRVADSCGLRVIFRSQCTVGRTSLRYQLRPSEVLVVKQRRGIAPRKQPCRS